LGGSAGPPLPKKFSGNMEAWEDWSYSLKNYAALFKTDLLEVMERSERSERPIADQDLAALITVLEISTETASLIVLENVSQNGFESWRLLGQRFSRPGTPQNISLLTRVLEYRFRTENFEQYYSEWEMLKNGFERQTQAQLPDSIMVAALLNKTAGHLQQHLRLNMGTLEMYDAVRRVITVCYQSRHVTNVRKTAKGPAPMEIGARWKFPGLSNHHFSCCVIEPGCYLQKIELLQDWKPTMPSNNQVDYPT
jgi:hypothetical protein